MFIDTVTMPTAGQYQCLLTIVDRASREVKLVPMRNKGANQVADALLKWILEKGPPRVVFADEDQAYRSSLMAELLRLCNSLLTVFSPYSHNNGLAESMNSKAEQILRATLEANPTTARKWPQILPVVEHVMNFSTQSTTGMSAKEYVCGFRIDLPDITDLKIPRSYPYHNQNSKELWGARLTTMTEARKQADSKRQRKSFEDAERRSNLRKNNKGPRRFEVGQKVWYKNPEVDRNSAKVKTTWPETSLK